jgi:hypothetical protein
MVHVVCDSLLHQVIWGEIILPVSSSTFLGKCHHQQEVVISNFSVVFCRYLIANTWCWCSLKSIACLMSRWTSNTSSTNKMVVQSCCRDAVCKYHHRVLIKCKHMYRRRDIQGIRSLPVISVVYQVRVGNLNRLHTYIPPKSRGEIKWQDSRSSVFAWIKLQSKPVNRTWKNIVNLLTFCWIDCLQRQSRWSLCHCSRIEQVGCMMHNWTHKRKWSAPGLLITTMLGTPLRIWLCWCSSEQIHKILWTFPVMLQIQCGPPSHPHSFQKFSIVSSCSSSSTS